MNEDRTRMILFFAGSAAMLFFCLIPFIYMVIISLSGNPDFLSAKFFLNLTVDNYVLILTNPTLHFPDYMLNSLMVSGMSALICVLTASLAAYAITRLPVPGKVFILLFVLAVSMFPQISLIGYLFKLMTTLGWINTYRALTLPYVAWILPLSLWILVSYFSQIPSELDKAALIDGCSRWQVLVKVIFPVAAPGIFSTLLLAFIFAFNEFLFALMLTTDHGAQTIPVGIASFQGLHGEVPWGTIMAASTTATIPLLILTMVFQRRIIQGLTHGAVKA